MRHAKIHVSFDTLAATFQREFTKKRRRLSKIWNKNFVEEIT